MAALTSSDHYHETIPTTELPAEVQRYAPPPRRTGRQENAENFLRRSPSIAPEPAPVATQPAPAPVAEAPTPAPAPTPTLTSATDLHRLMEKRSRELGATISVMEQQRQHLRSIEKQREINSREFAGAVDTFKEAARLLKEATASPEQVGDFEQLAASNRKALDQLEASVATMVANFQYWRTSWNQYQQTCTRAKELKLEMAATEPMTDA